MQNKTSDKGSHIIKINKERKKQIKQVIIFMLVFAMLGSALVPVFM